MRSAQPSGVNADGSAIITLRRVPDPRWPRVPDRRLGDRADEASSALGGKCRCREPASWLGVGWFPRYKEKTMANIDSAEVTISLPDHGELASFACNVLRS
jgi:hypothetical protein